MSTFFAGHHYSLKDYFGGTTHWVIPEYQREFSWGAENIDQLIRDLLDGIKRLNRTDGPTTRAEQAAKFLGCIIQWDRDPTPGDDFVIVPGLPFLGRVHELIDGQQRTTAITLLMCDLFIEIGALAALLDKSIPEEVELAGFLNRTVQQDWLLPRFSRSGMSGAVPRRRPTLIRQGTDRWIHAGPVEYHSPISLYMHSTIEAITAKGPLPVATKDKVIQEMLDSIREHLSAVKTDPPSILTNHYSQSELFEELYSGGAAVDIEAYLATAPANAKLIHECAALVALAHYLLNYAAFTVITSPNQNIALDMFQSLNSTGVQLTAVQLLKPRVSQSFRQNSQPLSGDPAFSKFEAVNDYLNTGRNSAQKTHQFFLKFGLGLFGGEPQNSLSVQRVWLLDCFNKYTQSGLDLSKTRQFVDLMSHTIDYLRAFYFEARESLFAANPSATPGGRRSYYKFKLLHKSTNTSFQLSDGAILAFMFLIDAKHDIAHSVLLSFFVRFQEAAPATAHAAKEEFEKALLMLAAFFLLWRGLSGTKYPDDAYRDVMGELHYTAVGFTGKAAQVGRVLRSRLLESLSKVVKTGKMSKKEVVGRLAKRLRYVAGTQSIIRLVLMVAAHKKTTLNYGAPGFVAHGLVVADSSGPDYLYPDVWVGNDCKSIEHVAPQSLLDGTPGDWDASLCAASDRIHSIGNLTLLSTPMNSSVPEDPKSKQLWYGGLVNPGAPAGVTPGAAALMAKSPNLAHLVPVYIRMAHWTTERAAGGACPNEWNGSFIEQRAENLATVVFRDLTAWLRAA